MSVASSSLENRNFYALHRTWYHLEKLRFFRENGAQFLDPNTTDENLKRLMTYETLNANFLKHMSNDKRASSFVNVKEPREMIMINYTDKNFDQVAKQFCLPNELAMYKRLTTLSDREIFMRYVILYQFGGVYASREMEKLKPLTGLLENMHPQENAIFFADLPDGMNKQSDIGHAKCFGKPDARYIGTDLIFAIPKQEFFKVVLHYLMRNCDPKASSEKLEPKSMAMIAKVALSDVYYELHHPSKVNPRPVTMEQQEYDRQVKEYYDKYAMLAAQPAVFPSWRFYPVPVSAAAPASSTFSIFRGWRKKKPAIDYGEAFAVYRAESEDCETCSLVQNQTIVVAILTVLFVGIILAIVLRRRAQRLAALEAPVPEQQYLQQ